MNCRTSYKFSFGFADSTSTNRNSRNKAISLCNGNGTRCVRYSCIFSIQCIIGISLSFIKSGFNLIFSSGNSTLNCFGCYKICRIFNSSRYRDIKSSNTPVFSISSANGNTIISSGYVINFLSEELRNTFTV